MKFTELSDYPVPAGTVTLWTPTTDADPAGWQADPRPFTHDQTALAARSVADVEGAENCWLGAVFEIEDSLDPDTLRSCLCAWLTRHEALYSGIDAEAPDPDHPRRTYRGRHLDVRDDVVGDIATPESVTALLTETFGARLAPTRWPHCLIATIAATGRSGFAVVFAADHMVMDAYSIMLSMSEIRRLYLAARRGLDAGLPAVGSHLDFSAHDRTIGRGLTADHPAVARWREFLDRSEDYPEFGLPLVRPRLETGRPRRAPRQRGVSEFVATDESATFLSATSRAAGHGTQTAVFAALAVTYREMTGRDTLRVTMPMHTRHEARYAGSVGWYVGLAPLEIDLTSATTFADALTATAAGIDAVRHLPAFPYQRIVELLETGGEPEFVVSYLDVRHVPGASEWDAARAQILRGSSRSDREVYMWIARVPSGMTLSARYPGHDPADDSIRGFVATYSSVLRILATEGSGLPLSAYTRTTYAPPDAVDDARPA